MTESVVILSTADFHASVWTNKQHLAVRLADYTRVSYIESIGLRPPTLAPADIKRLCNRMSTKNSTHSTEQRLHSIIKPRVIPFHGVNWIQAINEKSFKRQVQDLIGSMESPPVLWTFSPVTYGIEEYFCKTVYHSVDLLHALPNMPKSFITASEKSLVQGVDAIIASSTGVRSHLETIANKPVHLWENVADTSLYCSTKGISRKARAIFAGNLSAAKVDFSLIEQVALSGLEVLLAGPCDIDGTQAATRLNAVLALPGVTYIGNLGPTALAQALNSCTVGLIPYIVNDYTRGVFPLKVYEYLASGMAVVSTPLPSLQHIASDDVQVVDADEFVSAVIRVASTDENAIERRRIHASGHTWDLRIQEVVDLIDGILDTP